MNNGTIGVDTNKVSETATQLDGINNRILTQWNALEREIRNLQMIWDGETADHAINKFYEIQSKYHEAFSGIISQYSRYLRERVGSGYEETEQKNVENAQSLADSFL